MNAQIVELDASLHQKVQKLLPWAVLDKLNPAENAMLENHLLACSQCRNDLAWERMLQGVQPAAGAAPDMDAALARLIPQLTARPPARARGWMRWALAAQLLLIAGLGSELALQQDRYRLLGAPAIAGSNLVVVFRPDTSEGRLRALLQTSAARVVDGPTVTNAWVLQVAPEKMGGALAALRADPAVQLAEPLQAGGAK
ncbi:MAG: zf-HC2 domain-containing protein [Pseudomonadota bacterium]